MNDFETKLNEEIERRVNLIESSEYKFVPNFKKIDWAIIITTCVVSIILLVVTYNCWL